MMLSALQKWKKIMAWAGEGLKQLGRVNGRDVGKLEEGRAEF